MPHSAPGSLTLRRQTDEALALTGKDVGTPIIQFHPPEGVALLWLTRSEPARLFRFGEFPPLRGTLLRLTDERHVLYTRGSVPAYQT
jgi:hypothetical protein